MPGNRNCLALRRVQQPAKTVLRLDRGHRLH
jgi:hypothetical protein